MGRLTCPRCKATIECNSIEEGTPKLDHSIAFEKGISCCAGLVSLQFEESKTPKVQKPKEVVQSINTSKTVRNQKNTQKPKIQSKD